MNKFRGNWIASILVATLAFFSTPVFAELVPFEPVVGTLTGTGEDLAIFPFESISPGSIELILTDLGVPAAFQVLALAITDEFGNALSQIVGTDTLTLNFDVADPGNYLAIVGGVTNSDVNIGTFGLEISDVPVPGALWLMISALIGSVSFMRRETTVSAP